MMGPGGPGGPNGPGGPMGMPPPFGPPPGMGGPPPLGSGPPPMMQVGPSSDVLQYVLNFDAIYCIIMLYDLFPLAINKNNLAVCC